MIKSGLGLLNLKDQCSDVVLMLSKCRTFSKLLGVSEPQSLTYKVIIPDS